MGTMTVVFIAGWVIVFLIIIAILHFGARSDKRRKEARDSSSEPSEM
jgi:hypothetical protein